jgi:DNA-binding CsgD family transcriptional regulator
MSTVSGIIYIFSLLASFASIVIAVNLLKTYRRKYISQYLFFLIAYNISGFTNLIGRNLANEFYHQNPFIRTMTGYSMVLLCFPFFVLTLFFFISFTREIADQGLSHLFMIWYFITWMAVLVALLLGLKIYIASGDNRFLKILLNSINYGILMVLLFSLLKLLFQSRWIYNKNRQRGLRFLAILYIGLFSGCFLLIQKYSANPDNFYFTLIVIAYFALNFPPLLYLKYFMKKYFTSQTLRLDEQLYLGSFFNHYDISRQERVVVNFILEGRDNLSIAKQLSISRGTVKNHIYNIYKKVEVNSRVKLIQRIRDHLGKQ